MPTKQHNCATCSFVAKSKGGLSSHARRHKKASATPMKMKTAKPKASKKHVPESTPVKMASGAKVCRSCHALPVGSVEIVSLLLVLVFSLTAVLFTSVYVLESQNAQIQELQARIQSL